MPDRPDRILTSHAGSLPRPDDLIALNERRAQPGFGDEAGFQRELTAAVAGVVRRQQQTGIDLVNDGEYGHAMGQQYNYGSWWSYVFGRLGGLELAEMNRWEVPMAPPKPGGITLGSFAGRRDRQLFSEAYADPGLGRLAPGYRPVPLRPGVPGAGHLPGPGGGPARHREPEGRAGGRRARRGLPERGRARQLRPVRQRVLRDRRGAALRVRRRDARRSTARSSTPGSSCSSMTPASRRTGIRSARSRAWRTTGGSR